MTFTSFTNPFFISKNWWLILGFASISLVSLTAIQQNNFAYAETSSLPNYCNIKDGNITCTIEILGLQDPPFSPKIAHIPVGATIIVRNNATIVHTVTSTNNTFDKPGPEPNGIFDTGLLRNGQESKPFILNKPGSYYYYCAVHPEDMRGEIIVEENTGSIVKLGTNDTLDENQISFSSPANEYKIPSWIRDNAGWWSKGQVDDTDFIKGIQYLIEQRIMMIPHQNQSDSPGSMQKIPVWIKSNAGWWSQGKISDEEFVKGMQYLIANGIIELS